MAYTVNVPQLAQKISSSTTIIQANFAELFTDFGRNHVNYDFGTVADRGKHNVVTFPSQVATPPAIFGATEFGLYNMQYPPSGAGVTELFVRRNNAAVGDGIPFTANYVDNAQPGVGYTILPSGLKIAFGQFTTDGAGNGTQKFSDTAIPTLLGPAYGYLPFITVSPARLAGPQNPCYVYITNITIAPLPAGQQFTVKAGYIGGAPAAISIYWMAIGK